MAVPLALMAIPALAQAGLGIYQAISGAKQAKTPRPEYEIPGAATAALAEAKKLASQRQLPGQQLMEEQMAASTARTIGDIQEVAPSGAAALGAIGQTHQTEQQAQRDLALKGAQYQAANQAALRQQLGQYAGFQEKEFDINQMQPYLAAMATASAMKGAGMQNIYGGISSGAGAIAQHGMNKELARIQGGGWSNDQIADVRAGYAGAEYVAPRMGGIPTGAEAGFTPMGNVQQPMQQSAWPTQYMQFGQQMQPHQFGQPMQFRQFGQQAQPYQFGQTSYQSPQYDIGTQAYMQGRM